MCVKFYSGLFQLHFIFCVYLTPFHAQANAIVFFGTTRSASGFHYTKPPRPVPAGRAAAWYQNCIRNNTQGAVGMGTDSGFYVALRNRPLEGYFASAARENHQ